MKTRFIRTDNIHEMQQNAALEMLYRNDLYLNKQISKLRGARTRDAIAMFVVLTAATLYVKKVHEEHKSE